MMIVGKASNFVVNLSELFLTHGTGFTGVLPAVIQQPPAPSGAANFFITDNDRSSRSAFCLLKKYGRVCFLKADNSCNKSVHFKNADILTC
jgi:hypothetical protein